LEEPLLEIDNLHTHFFTEEGVVKAVDGVDLCVKKGEIMGLVGESGSGKTVTALSIMRLVPRPGRVVKGEIWFDGNDLLKLKETEMRAIRGAGISISFQDPLTYLNPVMKCGEQIAEVLVKQKRMKKTQALKQAIEIMKMMGIQSPVERANDYPHQLSGGMRQRVLLSIALACNPDLAIVDEPTTALDVITQLQIMELLEDLKEKQRTSFLLISHDMGVVAEVCDFVSVMYGGNIMESSDVRTLLKSPIHPYTKGLLRSIPRLDRAKKELIPIEGEVINVAHPPSGCKFHPRCSYAKKVCRAERPTLFAVRPDHTVACHRAEELMEEEVQR